MQELIESFRLRHEVFHREFREVQKTGLDVDRFDGIFDHLIIVHKETEKIIGTYRLNCTTHPRASYTAQEFDLTMIFSLRGPFLELGRACIHKDHRRGAVISLLWRGIAEYMNQSGAQVLFGCSSVKVNTAREAALIYRYLVDERMVTTDVFARPTQDYLLKNFDSWMMHFSELSQSQRDEAEALIPSLLKSYLKLGAKVACEPAFDKDFDCIDLLTVLKKEDLGQSLARRFQVIR